MATKVSAADLLRFRLQAHGLTGEPAASVEAVAHRMLAVQAQDLGQAGWGLGIRTAAARADDVAAAFSSGALVRSWPMRGTLHIVPARELGWMLELTTPRMLARTATRRSQLGLGEDTLERARAVMVDALCGGKRLNRAGALRAFEQAGIATDGQRGYHLIYFLAQTGTLVWGPPDANQQALVLLQEWVPNPLPLSEEAALTRFLVGYLAGHGPATVKDFVWWTNLTVAQARTARAAAGAEIADLECNGIRYLVPAALPDTVVAAGRADNSVHALPGFDEYVLGYQDRSPVVDAEFAARLIPGGNGIFRPTILSRGRAVGTWQRPTATGAAGFTVDPFTMLSAREQTAFQSSATRFLHYRAD
ncbi:winged helix DNA-binding domain-containing protein [Rathayibacter soli]|uniref:winged helix DNA-binding domain-containing protein n=1 Tax=Rathayibacter soli TaxID=3144168 RepID=UPI0027E54F38|nr:winged helix DNA-binding domain-containing protein [Glaciibacter superstes]